MMGALELKSLQDERKALKAKMSRWRRSAKTVGRVILKKKWNDRMYIGGVRVERIDEALAESWAD